MQSTDILTLDYKYNNIGKFFGSTKIQVIWKILLKGQVLNFTLYDSRYSGKVRLAMNDIQFEEASYSNNTFEVYVFIENEEFLFTKKNNNYDLIVNRIAFANLPRNKGQLSLSKLKALPAFKNFVPKKTNSGIVLVPTSSGNQFNKSPVKKTENISNYEFLENSIDLYDSEFRFNQIDEVNEDFNMVKAVNLA